MQIISIEPLPSSKSRRRITLDTRESFVLYAGELVKHPELRTSAFIDEDYYQQIKDTILLPRAKKRVLHLLEKQDRTMADVTDRLISGGYPPDVAALAAEYAASYGYIDDRRYTENYIYFNQEKKSRRRLFNDLLRKGVARELIEECLSEAELIPEEDKIKLLLLKKHYDKDTASQQDKARIIRFLMGRGYDYQTIKALI